MQPGDSLQVPYHTAVITRTPDIPLPRFDFVPAGFDPADKQALSAIIDLLLALPLDSADDLRFFVHSWSEVGARVAGEWARRRIAISCDTGDEDIREADRFFQSEIAPHWEALDQRLREQFLACPHEVEEFSVLVRNERGAAALYREENTKLKAEEAEKKSAYTRRCGSIMVELDGETITRAQAAVRFQDPDRSVRETAWRAYAAAMNSAADDFDDIFDALLGLRHKIARNAGHDDFVSYRFAELKRFDYGPAECEGFHAAVERVVVPVVRELNERRRERLGVETLRPWDAQAPLSDHAPARLFTNQDEYVALVQRVLERIDPSFQADFDILVRNGTLDLMTRPDKGPGGFNCAVEDIGIPFIFFSAAGTCADLRVLFHEAGHAFHSLAVRDRPVLAYRHAPIEFAEIASMAMEEFSFENLEGVLEPEELREALLQQDSSTLSMFTTIARGDALQTWFYKNPGHTREDRAAKKREVDERFNTGVDWSGLEDIAVRGWQWPPHPFVHPLYFIEYGIARLGALKLGRLYNDDPAAAIAGYRRALALGGSKSLPELFTAAGIDFAMDEAAFKTVVPPLRERINALMEG